MRRVFSRVYLSKIIILFGVLPLLTFPLTACQAEEVEKEAEQSVEAKEEPLKSLPFLVVNLDGDGFEYIPLAESNVYFDVDGDGLLEKTAWIKNSDGFLLIMPHLLSRENLTERERFLRIMTHGVSALYKFDETGNGVLNSQDQARLQISYWQDKNSDVWLQTSKEAAPFVFSGIVDVYFPNVDEEKRYINGVGEIIAQSYVSTNGGDDLPYQEIHFYYEDINKDVGGK